MRCRIPDRGLRMNASSMTQEQIAELIAKLEDFAQEKEHEGDRLGVTHLAAANFATGQAAGAQVAIDYLRNMKGTESC